MNLRAKIASPQTKRTSKAKINELKHASARNKVSAAKKAINRVENSSSFLCAIEWPVVLT